LGLDALQLASSPDAKPKRVERAVPGSASRIIGRCRTPHSASWTAVLNPVMHVFLRLVELACVSLRGDFADHLFKELQRLEATFPFVALDLELHVAVRTDGDVEFAVRHRVRGGLLIVG